MAVYTLQLPDGRKARIQAPDQESAVAAAGRIPPLKGEKADYQKELVKQRGTNVTRRKMDEAGGLGGFSAFTGSAPLPILDEGVGLLKGAGNELANVGRRVTGKPTVSSRAIYEANRDAANEYDAETRRLHPVASTAGGLLSGLGRNQAAGAVAKIPSRTKAVLQAMGVGAGTVAAYGAAEGRTLGERAKNSLTGGLVGGGTGGFLEGVAAPVVSATVKSGAGLVRDAARALKKPSAAKEAERGTASALKILKLKGLTSDVLEAERDELASRGVMAAERAGKDVERQLAATARRSGSTGDEVSRLVRERAEGAPDRMLADMEESFGIDPARAQAGIEEQGELGRALAKEDYAAIDANPAGIMSDELQEIMQRPDAQRALALVERSGRNAGRQGSGLAMGTVDVPAKPVGPEDLSFGATGAPSEMPVPRGSAEPPGRGPSALTFLRMSGHGITDAMGGEAKQAGLRLGARKGGAELNDMAIRLNEAGFTPRVLDETEMAELLDSGMAEKLFAREADAGAQGRHEARLAAEEFNSRGGNPDDLPDPDSYGAGPAPERPLTEPARMEAPTGQAWVQIKRTLDKMVKRDPVTKRVIRTGEEGLFNADLATLSRDLNEAMKNAVPRYREGVGKYAEPLAIEDAFARGQDFTGPKNTAGSFRKAWDSVKDKPAEADAFKAGVASNLYELWSRGELKNGRIKTPRMMGKLELAFGRRGAADFLAKLEREAQLAASGSRIAPTGGSPTMGLQEAGGEVDEALDAGMLARVGGKLGRLDVLGAGGELLGGLARYGKTVGTSEASRDAFGKVLMMGPDELIPLLREAEKLPPEVRAAVMDRANALGLLSGQVAGTGVAGDRPDR
jgi:hypothetical protein